MQPDEENASFQFSLLLKHSLLTKTRNVADDKSSVVLALTYRNSKF